MRRVWLFAGITLWCQLASVLADQPPRAVEGSVRATTPVAAADPLIDQAADQAATPGVEDTAALARHGCPSFGWLLWPVQRRLQWLAEREIVELVAALARGDGLQPGKGWFKGSQARLDWQWLADRFDTDRDGVVRPSELPVAEDFFSRLDRDRNGAIKADDFDWSDSSPFVREMAQARIVFRRADASSNGRVTRQEWQEFFERAAAGKEYITPDDLRAALFPPSPPTADEGPSPLVLFKGFLTGELGSVLEGPGIGDYAPQFALHTYDGKESYALAQFLGRPVVLVFGSFT